MYCNKCFEEIPDGSTRCPHCGAELAKSTKEKKKSGGSLFGGSKKKTRNSGGPRFDENGNLIDNNDSSGYSNTGGGSRRGGNGGSQTDPKILIILIASLVLIVVFIVGISLFMKIRRNQQNVPHNSNGHGSTDTSVVTDSSTPESAAESSAPKTVTTAATTPAAATQSSTVTVAPTKVATPTPATVTDSKSDNLKSSFDKDTADSFFWPYSDSRLYTFEDLENLSIEQIEFIKAEIYAREGCIFKDKKYSEYFNKKSWFKGSIDEAKFNPDRFLNYYELENVRMINTYLKEKR